MASEASVQNAHPSDQARVRPELIEELDHAGDQIHNQRHSSQRHGQIKNPTGECAGARLAQRCSEIELLALVVDHMRGPEQSHRVAPAMVPVVAKIVENERKDPHAPVAGGQVQQGPMLVDPLIEKDSEETEEHAHAGAYDAAAQAVDGIGQIVAAGMARAIDYQLQQDQEQKDRNGQRHGFSVKIVHTGVSAWAIP